MTNKKALATLIVDFAFLYAGCLTGELKLCAVGGVFLMALAAISALPER